MTEEKFAETIKGVDLSDKEKATLRMELGLSYDENLVDKHPTLLKATLMRALVKLPKPEPATT